VTHKNSGNDRNKIEVSVGVPVPARLLARDWKEFLRNFEPRGNFHDLINRSFWTFLDGKFDTQRIAAAAESKPTAAESKPTAAESKPPVKQKLVVKPPAAKQKLSAAPRSKKPTTEAIAATVRPIKSFFGPRFKIPEKFLPVARQ
jgi:hypothetical protein